jgi:hypothetical protein
MTPLNIPRAPGAPPPPDVLTHWAEHFASAVRDTGNTEWIASVDALTVLGAYDRVRIAQRAWEDQWEHYERHLVIVCREAGIPDAEIARRLGIPRQNLHRRHGKRGET